MIAAISGDIYRRACLRWQDLRLESSEGLVTVTGPNFRTKATQLGGSPPQVIARLLARELANEESKF